MTLSPIPPKQYLIPQDPRFAGKRLQRAKRKSAVLMLAGLLLGGGTVAYAGIDSFQASTPGYTQPGYGGPQPDQAQILATNLQQVAAYARQSAQLYIPPASGTTAPDAMLRQVFCDYLTQTSQEIARYNGPNAGYLPADSIADCFPQVIFDPTAFSELMNNVYQNDSWQNFEDNYNRALKVIFAEDATQIKASDKQILLDEAKKAFDALNKLDNSASGGANTTPESNDSTVQDTYRRLRQSNIMMALLIVSGGLLGLGVAGRLTFGVAEGVDKRVQTTRGKRRVKRLRKSGGS